MDISGTLAFNIRLSNGQKLQVQLHADDPKSEWLWIGGWLPDAKRKSRIRLTPDIIAVIAAPDSKMKGKRLSVYIDDFHNHVRVHGPKGDYTKSNAEISLGVEDC